ncbi:DUF2975 domain-containing protein [Saccharibacillus alkalitolerans]|uniref:DUF2975 domain-containing protein n=1 Tax=Saccharibacillus alkalitolerans TaxID=2705290 RepID=A0ABX0F2X8_9BACL|nr:DUF2975 domain-containing protein [Saccharibacillus alkalitolerans]NGZ75271.1 DUF2975 domain-containing protein [Saccharibacillus alkalitolerans]
MHRGTTLFLKAAVVLIGLPILAIYIFLVPGIGNFAAELYPEYTAIRIWIWIDLYATAIPFYLALYQSFRLLIHIERRRAFSDLAVQALKKIKYCGAAVGGLFAIGMPLYYMMAERDDAPGIIVIGLVIIFASWVIAVFAAVLQKLLQEAIAIQLENELTV